MDMWSCPYCGNYQGLPFGDSNLKGMLCLHPDCGRFDEMDESKFNELNAEKTPSQSLA